MCHLIRGHQKPSTSLKRTVIDLSKDENLYPSVHAHHHRHRHHLKSLTTAKKRSQRASKKTLNAANNNDDNNEQKFMEAWMKNNVNSFAKKDKEPSYTKTKNLALSPSKTVQAKKKQYETDDFRVNSMPDEPMMTPDAPPPMMAPVPNHVSIDNLDEGIHMPGPPPEEHHEEPHHYHIHHYEPPPYIEEPTYVHHIEPPPPPPPPEPVMIPVPIAAPPPPPPPPPPCTVHIPVTIHLKGKLAIKMKHCQNCDFSKNIEAIGPLKIGSLNGLKGKSRDAIESQATDAILSATSSRRTDDGSTDASVQGSKRNEPPFNQNFNIIFQRPIADLEEVLAKSERISFDDDFTTNKDHFEGGDVQGTKKDITNNNPTQLLVAKPVNVPNLLLPSDAFKRGVVISLPKGKALLKCIAPANDTKETKDTGSTFTTDESSSSSSFAENSKPESKSESNSEHETDSESVQPHRVITPIQTQPNEATLPAANDVITFSAPSNESKVIKPTSALFPPPSLNIAPQPSDKKDTSTSTNDDLAFGKSHKLTEKFLRMFDKDMLISLYKMAVKDILNELQRQKKAHRRSPSVLRRMQILESERTNLETQFPGISNSLTSVSDMPTDAATNNAPVVTETKRERRSDDDISGDGVEEGTRKDDIDNVDDEKSLTYLNTNGNSVVINPQTTHQLNGTRRVKLVDTYRPIKQSQTAIKPKQIKQRKLAKQRLLAKFHHGKINSKNFTKTDTETTTPEDASSALSFYGDLDPTKLMDDTPQCIDPLCEKHKQFIKHAGQYFQSLDSIALEPYKAFIDDKKDKETTDVLNQEAFEEPYGSSVSVQETHWNDAKSTKRQIISDTNVHSINPTDDPSTVVELFGKLPRVPLKITLNPKGPLARMKKPIEIDLRPPGKGEPSTRMIATSNDPTVAVHVANKIFKEEPLDPKQEQKLQQVYADIKKRSIDDRNHIKTIYLTPTKVIKGDKRTRIIVNLPNTLSDPKHEESLQKAYSELKRKRRSVGSDNKKDISQKAERRMKIIVSLPKELTKLVSQTNYQSVSRSSNPSSSSSQLLTMGSAATSPLTSYLTSNNKESSPEDTASNDKDVGVWSHTPTSSSLSAKPTYVVGQANEDKLVGKEESRLKPEIEEYEKKLKKLKEQTNAVMAQYNKMKDPYSDIGKKRRIKTTKKEHKHVVKYDPYADMGANVATIDKRSNTVELINGGKNENSSTSIDNLQAQVLNAKTLLTDLKEQQASLEKQQSTAALAPPQNPNPDNNNNNNNNNVDVKSTNIQNQPTQSSTSAESQNSLVQTNNTGSQQNNTVNQQDKQPQENAQLQAVTEQKKEENKIQANLGESKTPSQDVKENSKLQSNPSTIDAGVLNSQVGKSNLSSYEEIAQDPYATLGSSVSSLVKREKFPKRKKKVDKRTNTHHHHHHHHHHHRLGQHHKEVSNSNKRNLNKLHTKQDVPQQAISLIRHEPNDISKEVTMEPAIHESAASSTASDIKSPSEKQAKVEDNPSVKIDTSKPLQENDKTNIMQAFPKFSEALSKINPETRKKLLNLKPFKFLNKIEASSVPYNPTGKDPYADMGSEAETSSKRRKVASTHRSKQHSASKKSKTKTENASKRSETYDPYADLGTSIGLTQNEARGANNETQTVHVSLTNKTEDDTTQHEKQVKLSPPSARSDQIETFIGAAQSHFHQYDTIDPYADLGASANRITDSKSKTAATADNKVEEKQSESNLIKPEESLKTSTENNNNNNNSSSTAGNQPSVDIQFSSSAESNQSSPQNITTTSAMVQKVQNMIDSDVEHFVGKLKLPERQHEVSKLLESTHNTLTHDGINEMETGDMNTPNEIMDKLATVEKEIAGESDLATIEKLEKDIAVEKVKAEASSFPQANFLEQNVGKEIDGPYTDMGTKKQKTTSMHRLQHQRKTRDEIGTKKSLEYSHTYDEDTPQDETEHHKSLNKMEIINRLEAAVNALKKKKKKKSLQRKCLQNADVLKMMKHTGEHVGVNNPYNSIGKEVEDTSHQATKKQYINPCKLPIIDEEAHPNLNKVHHIKSESMQKSPSSSEDPYAGMGTTVRIADKKKEIAKKYDPYEDLGTVSVKRDLIQTVGKNKSSHQNTENSSDLFT